MKHVVNFSGGLCSFFAAIREIERHGRENVVLLFADTLIEDQDLYDFNRRAEDLLGIQITRVCYGLKPWELFRKEGIIGNNRFPICSVRLKREPLNEWTVGRFNLDENQTSFAMLPDATITLGFDWNELNRVSDFQGEHPTWRLSAPMTEAPYWDKCKMIEEGRKRQLKTPRLYALGFPHNNCGGTCVRAGITHFVHLWHVLRERFIEWMEEEWFTKTDFENRGIEPMSILKDRRGGITKPLWLRDLKARIESGEEFDKYDWGGCGCGGATT